MTSRFQLTALQLVAWQCAKRESLAADDKIELLNDHVEVLEEEIVLASRVAKKNYRAVLTAIFEEHHCAEVPDEDDVALELGDHGERYFVFPEPEPATMTREDAVLEFQRLNLPNNKNGG